MGPEPAGGWPAGTLIGYDAEKCEWIWAGGKAGTIINDPFGPIVMNPVQAPGCPFMFPGVNFCGTPFKKD